MTTGAVVLREAGGVLLGQMGGERLSWMGFTESRPLFAVLVLQDTHQAYFNVSWPTYGEQNAELRAWWEEDVAAYEVLAARMTQREIWHRVNILLIHVEMFRTPRQLRPLWPPPDRSGVVPPWPTNINIARSYDAELHGNPDDNVTLDSDRPSLELFRLTLEQAGSPVLPRLFYLDAPSNWFESYLAPGLAGWMIDSRDVFGVEPEVNAEVGQRWVRWATQVLGRVLF